MMQLLLFVMVGFVFLLCLWGFIARKAPVEGSARTLLEARQALSALQQGLLPPSTLDRIFSKSDYQYISALSEPRIEELFLTERKLVTLMWLGQIREQILCLRQFHLGAARLYARVSLATELRLASEFLSLLVICRVLQFAVYWKGPYAAPRLAAKLATAAATACAGSQAAVALLQPRQGNGVSRDSTSNVTAS
jgi:hypothetical protein